MFYHFVGARFETCFTTLWQNVFYLSAQQDYAKRGLPRAQAADNTKETVGRR